MCGELARVYNATIEGVPHCYPVDEQILETTLAAGHEQLRDETILVAEDRGEAVGFVHLAVEVPKEPGDPERGVIRFLAYEPGRRDAGQALLDAGEAYLRDHGAAEALAFSSGFRYPFYCLRHANLSVYIGHVHALLAFNGYEIVDGEIFMDWREFEPNSPDAADDFIEYTLEYPEGGGILPGVSLHAFRDGEKLGECANISCAHETRAESAQDWVFTTWLGVEEPHQGHGLGKRLLLRALAEARRIGYRHAAISTDLVNHRAFLFYANCGYRVVDRTHAFQKDL
jgi:GNAT superfamily N-acetyltransferase